MKRPVSPDNRKEGRGKAHPKAPPVPLPVPVTQVMLEVGKHSLSIPTPKTLSAASVHLRRQPPALALSGLPAPADPVHAKGSDSLQLATPGNFPGSMAIDLGASEKGGFVGPRPKQTHAHPLSLLRSRRARCANAADSPVACDLFLSVLAFLGDESKLYCSLTLSIHQNLHTHRILQSCAAETAIRYLSAFQRFASACESLNYSLIQLEEIEMADILITLSLERHEDISAGS